MIVIIDNFDSFTYNLVQYLRQLGARVDVYRNNVVTPDEVTALSPEGLIISPGPGRPESAGVSLPLIRHFSGKIPILGVCLGHQTIAAAFGAQIVSARRLMHGKTSIITADGRALYQGIHKPFSAMRYHSLAVSSQSFPGCLQITARADDGEIMGIRHRSDTTEGFQFHPESIMTPIGKRLLRNFINQTTVGPDRPVTVLP